MDRKNFISKISTSAVCVCMGGLAACVKATEIFSNTTSVLQIDLNTQLTTVGDSVSVGSVAVVEVEPRQCSFLFFRFKHHLSASGIYGSIFS